MAVTLDLVLVFVLSAPLAVAVAWWVQRGPTALAEAFRPGGPRSDWPRGVQEDDDVRWTWTGASEDPDDEPVTTVAPARVVAAVRRRPAPGGPHRAGDRADPGTR